MKRTVSTPHLVLGIIFAGIAALWFIGQGTDADISDTAPGFPLVLIGAGAVGLVASLANARSRNRLPQADVREPDVAQPEAAEPEAAEPEAAEPEAAGATTEVRADADEDPEPTTVIQEENR